jgi:hypothetical protein
MESLDELRRNGIRGFEVGETAGTGFLKLGIAEEKSMAFLRRDLED